jgi:hypothetical protein
MSAKRQVRSNISFGASVTISLMRRRRQRQCPWPIGASFQADVKKICAEKSARYDDLKSSSGSEGGVLWGTVGHGSVLDEM